MTPCTRTSSASQPATFRLMPGHLAWNVARFDDDLALHRYATKIREDFLSGVHSGVNGTPTFYINGVRHDGAWDFASLVAALQMAAT